MTEKKQDYIHKNKKYIDTPGLSDPLLREQAAREIEKALKENNNYKIIFVATLEAGRIRPDDLVTINKVCEAIQATFEYGIIFNKVTNYVMKLIQASKDELSTYLVTLHKQPASIVIIEKDNDMEDIPNVYFGADSENRKNLLDFITGLKANMLPASQVNPINTISYEKQVEEMAKQMTELRNQFDRQIEEIKQLTQQLNQATLQLSKQSDPSPPTLIQPAYPPIQLQVSVNCLVM